MEETYEIYAMDNQVDEFYSLRPELNEYQYNLLDAFYKARRDAQPDCRITAKVIEESLSSVNYEIDIGVSVIQKLDDHYLSKVAEKRRRQLKQ